MSSLLCSICIVVFIFSVFWFCLILKYGCWFTSICSYSVPVNIFNVIFWSVCGSLSVFSHFMVSAVACIFLICFCQHEVLWDFYFLSLFFCTNLDCFEAVCSRACFALYCTIVLWPKQACSEFPCPALPVALASTLLYSWFYSATGTEPKARYRTAPVLCFQIRKTVTGRIKHHSAW